MLNIGITTRSFSGLSIAETAREMAEGGFLCTELCFVHPDLDGFVYNGIGDLTNTTPARVRKAAEEFRSRGIAVTSLGMFTDLRSRDVKEREKAIEYTKRHIEMAAEAGIPLIASECGFTPGSRGIQADSYEEDYQILKETLRIICTEAENSGVRICLEACVLDVIPSPRLLRVLIEELICESGLHLGTMLDPANFLANSDEEGMFRYLGDHISYLHGKDRKLHATYGINLGDGDIDWVRFMSLYRQFADGKPFVLEYCKQDVCREIRARALAYYEKSYEEREENSCVF